MLYSLTRADWGALLETNEALKKRPLITKETKEGNKRKKKQKRLERIQTPFVCPNAVFCPQGNF